MNAYIGLATLGHMTRWFHGVLAPNYRWRGLGTPARRGKGVQQISDSEPRSPAERHAAMTLAQKLKRVFNIEVCGGSIRGAACSGDQYVTDKVLAHFSEKEQSIPCLTALLPKASHPRPGP